MVKPSRLSDSWALCSYNTFHGYGELSDTSDAEESRGSKIDHTCSEMLQIIKVCWNVAEVSHLCKATINNTVKVSDCWYNITLIRRTSCLLVTAAVTIHGVSIHCVLGRVLHQPSAGKLQLAAFALSYLMSCMCYQVSLCD